MTARRLPVRLQLGTADPNVVAWLDLSDHDGPGEVIDHLVVALRQVADEFEAQRRYSRHERD